MKETSTANHIMKYDEYSVKNSNISIKKNLIVNTLDLSNVSKFLIIIIVPTPDDDDMDDLLFTFVAYYAYNFLYLCFLQICRTGSREKK